MAASPKWLVTLHRFVVLYFARFLCTVFRGKGAAVQPTSNDAILKCSATALARKIRRQELTSVAVMEAFIARIAAINPLLNCVVDQRYAAALADAAAADSLIASGRYTEAQLEKDHPYLGVPISTKDCLAVRDLLHTSGLVARRSVRATEDSAGMALMRRAGAIPFALTNVSECCMWWESHNPVHGLSRNPYDSNRIVGGSSGGEGCLQSASGSPLGIGSDIGGSIRMPAFFNGIFGHKPSRNIVSAAGQWPQPHGELRDFLGIGPMSRYAEDLVPVLRIMAGENAAQLRLDEPVDLSKVRVFYQFNDGGADFISSVDDDLADAVDAVVQHFGAVSATKPQRTQMALLRKSASIWLGNMKSPPGPERFDSQLTNMQGAINPYWELTKWPFGASNHTLIAILTALTERMGVRYGSSKHAFLVRQRDELRAEFSAMLGDNGVFVYPTHPTVAPYHHEPIARAFNFSYTAIVNVLGLPATAVPMGVGSEGLPLGVQVIANHNQDRLCLAVASELERKFGGWKEPGTV